MLNVPPTQQEINDAKTRNAKEVSYQYSKSTESWCLLHTYVDRVDIIGDTRFVMCHSELVCVGMCMRCGHIGVEMNEVTSCNCRNEIAHLLNGDVSRWTYANVHICRDDESEENYFVMHPMKFCKFHNGMIDEDENGPLQQLREKVKVPLKSLVDMGREDGIYESNVVRQHSMTLAVLFERKTSTGGAIRLQWLVGNPGEYEPTLRDIKVALIEAMSHTTTHKKFMLSFKSDDKWYVPYKAGKNYIRGNADFYQVLMTVNGLRKLRER